MRWKKLILICLFISLTFLSRAWAAPSNWAVRVPTHAQYLGDYANYFYSSYVYHNPSCNNWDLSGINHLPWTCCCGFYNPGHLDSADSPMGQFLPHFNCYEIRGDYYDCNGDIIQSDQRIDTRCVVKGTGTIFSGGIGGGMGQPVCYLDGVSPATECRVFYDMTPVLRTGRCSTFPDVPPSDEEKNLGHPRKDSCDKGSQPLYSSVGNPVNVATGNKYEESSDLSVSTPGIPLEFVRSYNSRSKYKGPLGYGWTHNFNLSVELIEESPAKRVRIWDGDGRGLYFTQIREAIPGEIAFAGESGVKDRLRQVVSTGEYFLRRKQENLTYKFGSDGKLVKISDSKGDEIKLTYTEGRLTQISDNYGKKISIQYNGAGRIESITDPKGQSISFQYQNGNLTKVIYPDWDPKHLVHNSVAYVYDNHQLIEKKDTNGRVIGHWDYDAKGRVITYYSHLKDDIPQDRIDISYSFQKRVVTRSTGETVYTIGTIGQVKVVKEIEGCATCGGVHKRLDYTEQLDLAEVTSISDGNEHTTLYTYDDPVIPWEHLGEIVQVKEAVGTSEERTTDYSYTHRTDDPFLLTQSTETQQSVVDPAQDKVTALTYTTQGNILTRQETGYVLVEGVPTQTTHTTQYEYNTLGQLTKIDGPRSDVSDITTLEYYRNVSGEGNNRGQLKAIVNALGQRTEFLAYDANGNLKRLKDPNGVTMLLSYDERNRITSISNLTAEATTTYSYDGRGKLTSVVFPEGNTVKFTYDLGGGLDTVKDALGNKIHYEYDREGNRIREEVRDQDGTLTKFLDFGYDPYKRLKQIIQPDATFTEYTYDGYGNRTKILDPRGNETSYTYDSLNRLTQTTEPGTIVTGFEYNTQDQLTKVTDANTNVTEYRFDDFGRRFETISPDTGTTGYRYDEAGNLVQKTDARGVVVNYSYDPLNRLTSVTFPDPSENITYVYDDPSVSYGVGRLTGRTDPSGSYTFHYDAQGNLIREIKKVGDILYRTRYTYNKNNVLTSLVYPTGRKVTYTLDGTGKIVQVTSPLEGRNQVRASRIQYVPFGGVNGLAYGNGLLSERKYDNQYRTTSITAGSVLRRTYEHDPNGNITSIADLLDAARSQTFGYDSLNRLSSATGIYGEMSYTYDPVGNRSTETVDGNTETYTYEAGTNRLTQIDGEQPKTFTYEQNGNTASENDRIYEYNQADRLSDVSEDAVKLGEYVYNGEGQRIKKATQAATRVFHYDLMGHLIAETDEQGNTQAEYVYLGDAPYAMIDKEGAVYYFHTDHLGTPQALTDKNQNVVWKADYKPFGQAEILIQNVENPFRFPGQYYDKETGLHYNYFRYYNPQPGRYITPDPIGLRGGIDPYAYVGNNPANFVDPEGLLALFWHFGITALASWNSRYGVLSSLDLAWKTMAVDFGESAADTVRHAMAIPGQTSAEAIAATKDYIQRSKCNDVAGGVHATQDLATPGHEGKEWFGYKFNWETGRHILGDIFPSFDTINRAYQSTRRYLR